MNPINLLLLTPPGTAMPILNHADDTVMIAVREDKPGILKYGNTVPCSASLIGETIDGVMVLCLLMKLGTHKDSIFEVYFNVHSSEGHGKKMLDRLAMQEKFQVSFYVRTKAPARQITFANSLREQFRQVIAQTELLPPWGMREFDGAKRQFQIRHDKNEIERLIKTQPIERSSKLA